MNITKTIKLPDASATGTKNLSPFTAYALAYPFALPLSFFLTWLTARVQLGHWPRPSLDDPKQLGTWVAAAHNVTLVLMTIGLPLFAIAVAILLWQAIHSQTQRKSLIRISVISTVCMLVAILFLRWDPWHVIDWFFD